MTTKLRVGIANAQQTDNYNDVLKTITRMVSFCTYLMLNEAGDAEAHRAIATFIRGGWMSYIPLGDAGANPHMWRGSQIVKMGASSWQLMKGGRLGLMNARVSAALKRKYAGRRLGPGRWATAVRFNINLTPHRGIFVCVHLMARTKTVEKWRRPLYLASRMTLILWLANLHRKYPDMPIFVAGDFNDSDTQLNGDWNRVPMPADYGRSRYTHFYYKDTADKLASVKHYKAVTTESDHKGELVDITWKDAA